MIDLLKRLTSHRLPTAFKYFFKTLWTPEIVIAFIALFYGDVIHLPNKKSICKRMRDFSLDEQASCSLLISKELFFRKFSFLSMRRAIPRHAIFDSNYVLQKNA
jgi:hypothetical protein